MIFKYTKTLNKGKRQICDLIQKKESQESSEEIMQHMQRVIKGIQSVLSFVPVDAKNEDEPTKSDTFQGVLFGNRPSQEGWIEKSLKNTTRDQRMGSIVNKFCKG